MGRIHFELLHPSFALLYNIVIFITVFHSQIRPSGNEREREASLREYGRQHKTTAEKAVCKG